MDNQVCPISNRYHLSSAALVSIVVRVGSVVPPRTWTRDAPDAYNYNTATVSIQCGRHVRGALDPLYLVSPGDLLIHL